MNTLKTVLYMGIMHGLFTYFLPYQFGSYGRMLFDPGILRYFAFPLWITGTIMIIRCSREIIHLGRGTPAHMDPPKELLSVGLYRYVRNPIYLGALFVQLGYILWFGAGIMIVYFLVFVLAFHLLIILVEEPILR
ncbi:MAG: methyltransferase, partial [Anaerolineales bacterium]|nr:methyltransferase [Anaerolineales bacterium]